MAGFSAGFQLQRSGCGGRNDLGFFLDSKISRLLGKDGNHVGDKGDVNPIRTGSLDFTDVRGPVFGFDGGFVIFLIINFDAVFFGQLDESLSCIMSP